MTGLESRVIRSAEIVLPCGDLDAALAFYVEKLGFRLDAIFPADAPAVAVISGHGLHLRLERRDGPHALRLAVDDAGVPRTLASPDGLRVELVQAEPPLVLPPLAPSFVTSHAERGAPWVTGRAGMQYRDLIPGRQGGRFIASHIRIPAGGPVPDYVHYHRVRFQVIYCVAGWVRVVYEDQGPPFVLDAGDCVLQPPRIRHRVLECSPGLEVVELSCPAEHETFADHDLALPTAAYATERDFDGQRFVRHVARDAAWQPARLAGFTARDTGIAEATRGLGDVQVLRRSATPLGEPTSHDGELRFWFVLQGSGTLACDGHPATPLARGDAVVAPPGVAHAFVASSPDLELLQIAV